MRNIAKRLLEYTLTAALALAALGCTPRQAPLTGIATPQAAVTGAPVLITPQPLPATAHTDVRFSDMRYERPDTEAIAHALDSLTEGIGRGEPAERLVADYAKIKARYDAADSQTSLAYLLYAFDVTDMRYEQEYALLQSALTALDLAMTDVTIALCESSDNARQLLANAYGEEYLDAVYAGKSLNSDTVQALMDADQTLVSEYDRLMATFALSDGGREWTMDDIRSDGSLSTREFYRLYDAYCAALNTKAGAIYARLLAVRSEIAEKLGYGSYAAYRYDCYDRDYTVTDAKTLHAAVKKHIVPVFVSANGAQSANSEAFAPQEPEPTGLAAEWREFLRILLNEQHDQKDDIFDLYELSLAAYDLDDYLGALSAATLDFSPSLHEALSFMLRNNLYNFSVSPKKMAGSFTTYISQYNAPFIFTQWNNNAMSIDTVLHELGHFTNYYHNPSTGWSQSGSLDLAEVDSQALQLLMMPYYPQLYGQELAYAAEYSLLLDCMYALITGCMEDEFQQSVYAKPGMPLADMNALYLRLAKEYGLADLYGYTGTEWALVPHTFQSPMYYISYAASMVPALELWRLSLTNSAQARTAYLKILDRASYASFRDTLTQNGLPDVFDETTIANIATLLDEQI